MTITSSNWCPTCEEECNDHAAVCTICGDTLGSPPRRNNNNNASQVRATPEFLNDDVRLAGRELRGMLTGLSGQVRDLNDLTRGVTERWQTVPAELLEPQQERSTGRPTAKKTLATIPRITLEDKSSLFRQTTLKLFGGSGKAPISSKPICGEFGPSTDILFSSATVVVAFPRTGKGGLSEETKSKIRSRDNPLVYMERGDGITFVKKAIMAQEAGAVAVIIGNNISHPWPYLMQDKKDEASKFSLKIPVVMVKQEDGQKIVEFYHDEESSILADFSIKNQPQDCVICRETFQPSQSVVQLPSCGHVFHDTCALVWLKKHNTCPYCRLELPTDDKEYEEERRRLRRTHAGSNSGPDESEWNAYYG